MTASISYQLSQTWFRDRERRHLSISFPRINPFLPKHANLEGLQPNQQYGAVNPEAPTTGGGHCGVLG